MGYQCPRCRCEDLPEYITSDSAGYSLVECAGCMYKRWIKGEDDPPRKGSGDFSIGGQLWPGVSKLIEECGEVIQVAGKLIGSRGVTEHWDGSNLYDKMVEELADLRAAIDFVVKYNELDSRLIDERVAAKTARFERWHCRPHSNDVEQQRCGVCNGLVDLDEGCKRCGK